MMWKIVVFTVLASVFTVGLGAMTGGFSDVDVSDQGLQNAMNFAVVQHNKSTNDVFLSQVAEVVKAQRQDEAAVSRRPVQSADMDWFRPKLQFKVPTRVKKQIIALSTDPSICKEPRAEGSDWEDYVWFQAPVNIKGFSN